MRFSHQWVIPGTSGALLNRRGWLAAIAIGSEALAGAGSVFFTAGGSETLAGGGWTDGAGALTAALATGGCTGGSGLATVAFFGTNVGVAVLVGDFLWGGDDLTVDVPVAWLTMGEGSGTFAVVGISLSGDKAARACLI